MSNDLFDGLGGLMKAQSDLNDLKNQETALYAEIGRQCNSVVTHKFRGDRLK